MEYPFEIRIYIFHSIESQMVKTPTLIAGTEVDVLLEEFEVASFAYFTQDITIVDNHNSF